MQTQKKQSGFGIASLILGIVGLLLACIFIGIIPCILGIIFAIVALLQKDKAYGTAIAGLICSVIGAGIFSLMVCAAMFGAETEETGTGTQIEGRQEVEAEEKQTIEESQKQETEKVEEQQKQSEIVENIEPISEQETKEEFIAACKEIDYKTLARNPQDYIGEKIVLTVRIEQIVQGGLFDEEEYYRVYTQSEYGSWYGDEYFMFDCRVDDSTKILDEDILKVYAEFAGIETVTRALTGVKEDVLSIDAIYIEFIDEEEASVSGFSEEILNDGVINADFGSFSVTYDSYEITKNYEEKDCIIIYYNYTNNSGETTSARRSTDLSVFQDGIECELAYLFDDNEFIDNYSKEVKSGTTIKVGEVFELLSKSDVELEMEEAYSWNVDKKDIMSLQIQ